MADDISKVVRFRCPTCGAAEHSRERRPNGNSKCVAGHSYPSRDAIDSSANRLKSATTPAEGGGNTPIADLLAEYEAEGCNHRDTAWLIAAANRYVETMRDSQTRCLLHSLARQLAEARAEIERLNGVVECKTIDANERGNALTASAETKRDLKAQLAEATRRLGEVEKAAQQWRQDAREMGRDSDPRGIWNETLVNCADRIHAALTKEPTK